MQSGTTHGVHPRIETIFIDLYSFVRLKGVPKNFSFDVQNDDHRLQLPDHTSQSHMNLAIGKQNLNKIKCKHLLLLSLIIQVTTILLKVIRYTTIVKRSEWISKYMNDY